jgi:hypothetical protein
MSDEPPSQAAINKLLEMAKRCQRLANDLIDRQTREWLLEMAKEYEEKAAELQKQTSGYDWRRRINNPIIRSGWAAPLPRR